MSPSPSKPGRLAGLLTVPRVVTSVGLAIAVTALVVGFQSASDPPSKDSGNALVDEFIPLPRSQVLRQAQVGIDLVPGYSVTLEINGKAIPDDQVEQTIGLDKYIFSPGDGKELKTLPAGDVCAAALLTPITDPRATPIRIPWCFQVSV